MAQDAIDDIAPLPELLERSVAAFAISTEELEMDGLLSGDAARHFPESRSRRKEDVDAEDIQRLRAILEALDKGLHYPDEAIENTTPPLHSQFYKQF